MGIMKKIYNKLISSSKESFSLWFSLLLHSHAAFAHALAVKLLASNRSMSSTLQDQLSSSSRSASDAVSLRENDDEVELQWAAIERLPTFKRIRTSLVDNKLLNIDGKGEEGNRMIDVTRLGASERRVFIDKLITVIEEDNLRLLKKLKERIARQEQEPCPFHFFFACISITNIEINYELAS